MSRVFVKFLAGRGVEELRFTVWKAAKASLQDYIWISHCTYFYVGFYGELIIRNTAETDWKPLHSLTRAEICCHLKKIYLNKCIVTEVTIRGDI